MKNLFIRVGVAFLTFHIAFFAVTAICDWICKANGYYEQAALEVIVLE